MTTKEATIRSLPGCHPILTIVFVLFCSALHTYAAQPKPNFLIIEADDLGAHDLGCMGNTFHQTTHLDRLAREGARFTAAYSSAPVCSPSRAALLTGKAPARLGLTRHLAIRPQPSGKLLEPRQPEVLALSETTLAEALKRVGYATGIVGKWHLGKGSAGPAAQGFDFVYGGDDDGLPRSYFSPYGVPQMPDGPPGEYLTDRLTAEAERFLEDNKARSFLLVLTHFAPHIPLEAPRELIAKYAALALKDGQRNATYAAMLEKLDDSTGRLLAKLDALKLTANTVVIFTSDNGGVSLPHPQKGEPMTANGLLRGGKASLYEGGLRVPLLIRWPGTIRAGIEPSEPVVGHDLPRTLLDLAGVPPQPDEFTDGVSLASLLTTGASPGRDALFFHYPHYHQYGAQPGGAVRAGDWKLVEHFEDGRLELYNLARDRGETQELSKQESARAASLHEQLTRWRESVGAKMPTANPGR